MAEPFLGEVRMFSGNYAPRGWHLCDGSTLRIADYDALYSLVGTTYGGDGRATFGLPDLRGRIPLHQGQGTNLTDRKMASHGGSETVSMTVQQMPAHQHSILGTNTDAVSAAPAKAAFAKCPTGSSFYAEIDAQQMVASNPATIQTTGKGTAYDNRMPFMVVNFIIATQGIYPNRT